MTLEQRRFPRLLPLAGAFALSIALAGAAQAQGPAGATAPAAATQEVALSAAERQQFVGAYILSMPGMPDRSMPFRVYEEQGALYGQPQGGEAKRIIHQGKREFRVEGDAAIVTFIVEEGKPTRFSVTTPEGKLEGTREDGAAR